MNASSSASPDLSTRTGSAAVPKRAKMSCSGRFQFLVLSWSNICYLGFQSAVLVAIRAAQFQVVTKRWCTVTAEAAGSTPVVPAISFQSLSDRFCFSRLLSSPISNLSRLISVSCTDFDCFQELSLTCPLYQSHALPLRFSANRYPPTEDQTTLRAADPKRR